MSTLRIAFSRRVVSPVDGSVTSNARWPPTARSRPRSRVRRARNEPGPARRWPSVWPSARGWCAWMLDRADAIGEELTWQMGRPIAHTPNEIRRGFQRARAPTWPRSPPPRSPTSQSTPTPGFRRFIRREPLGVVLVLAPVELPVAHLGQRGRAGAPRRKRRRAEDGAADAARRASATPRRSRPPGSRRRLPERARSITSGGAHRFADPRVAFVAFTGSVDGGPRGAAARRPRASSRPDLELGGKDPAYVRADAPLEHAIENLVDGTYFNAGQSCCGIERIYVHARCLRRVRRRLRRADEAVPARQPAVDPTRRWVRWCAPSAARIRARPDARGRSARAPGR